MKELLLLSGLGVVALLAEIFNFKKILHALVVIGLVAVIGACISDWSGPTIQIFGMLELDHFALAFTLTLAAVALLWFLVSGDYFQSETSLTDHYALILFALTGAFLLVSYTNMVMLFLGIEILSIPLYVLAGSKKDDLLSNEAAFKYFLMGAFASSFLLFGIALVYGAVGSFDLREIYVATQQLPSLASQPFLLAGIILILIGMSFKVSLVPFHSWAPDVYQGSPTLITVFMATIVKVSAFAAIWRLFATAFLSLQTFTADLLWIMIALTFVIGNVLAAVQTNVKRILAFSSISHAGFFALAILCFSQPSASALLYYSIAYCLASIVSFTVLYLVKKNTSGEETVAAFTGLAQRNPLLAFVMTVSMLSLAGIPPLSGFFAKYFMLRLAISSGHLFLTILAILGSLIGVYYYFKILIAMYAKESSEAVLPAFSVPAIYRFVLLLCTLAMLLIGIFPDRIFQLL